MPKFQKRHYEAIAAILGEVRQQATHDLFLMETCERFTEAVTRAFEKDNPRFDRDRFNAATGR